ncbi:enoyl-CoA hydratase/isomerase family protein [Nocardioides sp. cx-169]|uniref:enoyl-CoA hydratase/isomerase family protein n=1 Tax=Nocardioides sp. cx-169 TaxID=2899080 RepID=UPI001E4B9E2E|nr:enoyl-CoA hydratase/isomerase family protein [Nocardioides sp. cx-169]MCD4532998.1 enoyl-CoA hydratase/isomerase family protein [Nocardioides sp. cx-169]
MVRCSLSRLVEAVDGRPPWADVAAPREPLLLIDLDDSVGLDWHAAAQRRFLERLGAPGPILVGLAPHGVPPGAAPLLERLTVTVAPSGPGRTWVDADPVAGVAALEDAVAAAPLAASALAGLLRITDSVPVAEGLLAESFAYSTLLAGPEFQAWRAATPRRAVPRAAGPVLAERVGDVLRIALNRPTRHNAFDTGLRAALIGALEIALADGSVARIELSGHGPSFSSGGDLDEFGSAPDVATAHVVRSVHSPGYLLHRLADRTEVRVQGAVVGAGIEVAAFAHRVVAREGAWFRLPEVSMGLVPGAGGTVSVPRRIGRWRAAWMALTGERVGLDRALAWGLVDARA